MGRSCRRYISDAMLELYRTTGCPYCRKVERTLEDLGLEYASHDVSPFRGARDGVREISGQSGVPVLVDRENGVTGMAESDAIVAYLERTYG